MIMPTWNSNQEFFPLVLKRVKEIINPHHFIVIDRYSSDGTIDLVLSIFPRDKLRIVQADLDLGPARALGIKLADTDVIGFIDSDVLIPLKLRNKISEAIKIVYESPKIGAVCFSFGSDTRSYRVIRNCNYATNKEILINGLNKLCRGFTFLCFMKKSLVYDWISSLSAFEDFSLSQHVITKGYHWIELGGGLTHLKETKYKGLERFLKQGLWEGANMKLVSIDFQKAFMHILGRLGGALIKAKPDQLITYIGYVLGYVNSRRFLIWRR